MDKIFIGLMTGTSADSLDLAAVDFSNEKLNVVGTKNFEIPKEIKIQIKENVNTINIDYSSIDMLDAELGKFFANSIEEFVNDKNISKNKIVAVGSHGQTIKHDPSAIPPISMQLGDPQLISNETNLKTIGNFRQDDIEAGGQGAPLSPLFHEEAFKDNYEERIIVNIGGITNISLLSKSKLLGFDTGPGNCLLDSWSQMNKRGNYDAEGKWAKSGKVNQDLIKIMLGDKYFALDHPKSTGPDYFNLHWIEDSLNKLGHELAPEDVQATLTELTVVSLFDSLKQLGALENRMFLCGGGIHNDFLMSRMSSIFNQDIQTTSNLGVDPDFLEAICFAWLAYKRINNVRFDLKEITGSKEAVFLGRIYDPVI